MSGEATAPEAVQEGSRWLGAKPSGEVFSKWFLENVRMHDDMDPKLYLPGIILIPQSEKIKVKERAANGRELEKEIWRDTYTPYAKVDTRIAYFWDLCERRDWVGEIEKVVPNGAVTKLGEFFLPEGFYAIPYPLAQGGYGVHICCTAQVRIYRRDRGGEIDRRQPVMLPPAGTKVVKFTPPVGRDDATNHALKCETGAIGRALGFAGMLVIPGSGVATAEDMQEVLTTTTTAAEVPEVATPIAAAEPESIDERITALFDSLDEQQTKQVIDWANERKIDPGNPNVSQKRALLAQLERVTAG
jgi:hypothetical protein